MIISLTDSNFIFEFSLFTSIARPPTLGPLPAHLPLGPWFCTHNGRYINIVDLLKHFECLLLHDFDLCCLCYAETKKSPGMTTTMQSPPSNNCNHPQSTR